MWLVLFVLLRIDWGKGLVSVGRYVQVEPWKTVKNVKNGKDGHFWDTCEFNFSLYGTPARHFVRNIAKFS